MTSRDLFLVLVDSLRVLKVFYLQACYLQKKAAFTPYFAPQIESSGVVLRRQDPSHATGPRIGARGSGLQEELAKKEGSVGRVTSEYLGRK